MSGDRYMDDLLRGVMAKELANTGRAPRTRDQLKAHMAAGGDVIVEGHPLTDAIYRSIAGIDLTSLEPRFTGPAFIAQISRRAETRPREGDGLSSGSHWERSSSSPRLLLRGSRMTSTP